MYVDYLSALLEWAPSEGDLAGNYGPSPRRPQLLTDSPAAEFRSRRSRWRSRADWPRSGGWIGGSTGVVWGASRQANPAAGATDGALHPRHRTYSISRG